MGLEVELSDCNKAVLAFKTCDLKIMRKIKSVVGIMVFVKFAERTCKYIVCSSHVE